MAPISLPRPRLLPVTMAGLAALLAVKAAGLIEAAYGAGQVPLVKESWPSLAAAASAGSAAASSGGAAWALVTPSSAVPVPVPMPMPEPTQLAEAEHAAAAPAEHGAGPVAAPPPVDVPLVKPGLADEPVPSPAERSLLVDLRKRREELDARTAKLEQREALMAAQEKRLSARVDELGALQKRLEALEAARRDRDDSSWRGLVRVYESMKPKDAALIFNDLDEAVLLQVVDRMKDTKTSSILAAMLPDRARRLTADLSALRARANARPEALSPRAPPDTAPSASGPAVPVASAPAPNASPPGASP